MTTSPANPNNNLYGFPVPLTQAPFAPVVAQRAPTTADVFLSGSVPYQYGQIWVDQANDTAYIFTNVSSGDAEWVGVGGGSLILETLTGDSGGAIAPSGGNITLAGGTGVSTVGSGSTITFNVTGAGFKYTDVTGTTQAMAINNAYFADNSGLVTLTLPAVAAQGSVVGVVGKGSGGWTIAQNALQVIHQNSSSSTVGTGGSVSSTAQYNCAFLVCSTANTNWVVYDSEGILTFV